MPYRVVVQHRTHQLRISPSQQQSLYPQPPSRSFHHQNTQQTKRSNEYPDNFRIHRFLDQNSTRGRSFSSHRQLNIRIKSAPNTTQAISPSETTFNLCQSPNLRQETEELFSGSPKELRIKKNEKKGIQDFIVLPTSDQCNLAEG